MPSSGFFKIYFNLFKACVGTGILIFPFLTHTYGMFGTTLLTTLSCLASTVSCLIFIDLIENKSKECEVIDGLPIPLKYTYNIVLVVKCFLTSLSYFQVIYSIIRYLTDRVSIFFTGICLLAGVVCSYKDRRLISNISFIGIFGVIALFLGSFYLYTKLPRCNFVPLNSKSYLGNLGFFVFSFNCQHSIFSAVRYTNLSPLRTRFYTILALLSAFIVYLGFGWLNCQFIDSPKSNILENWNDWSVLYTIYPFYGVVVFGSLILQMDPIGENFQCLIGIKVNAFVLYFSMVTICYITVLKGDMNFAEIVRKLVSPFSAILGYVLPGLFLCVEAKLSFVNVLKVSIVFIFAVLSLAGAFSSEIKK